MSTRKIPLFVLAALLAVAVAGIPGQAHAGSITYEIKFDTSVLDFTPTPAAMYGLIDISLNPTYAQSPASVAVQAFNPSTDGTLVGAPFFYSGTAAGDLTTPAGVTADNSQVPNELQQNFAGKSFFDVFVTLSGSEIGPGASGNWSGTVFSISIFDTSPGGNYLSATLTVNPTVGPNGPVVDGTVLPGTYPPNTPYVQIIQLAVPEPSSVVLLSLGMGAVVAIGRWARCGTPPDRERSLPTGRDVSAMSRPLSLTLAGCPSRTGIRPFFVRLRIVVHTSRPRSATFAGHPCHAGGRPHDPFPPRRPVSVFPQINTGRGHEASECLRARLLRKARAEQGDLERPSLASPAAADDRTGTASVLSAPDGVRSGGRGP